MEQYPQNQNTNQSKFFQLKIFSKRMISSRKANLLLEWLGEKIEFCHSWKMNWIHFVSGTHLLISWVPFLPKEIWWYDMHFKIILKIYIHMGKLLCLFQKRTMTKALNDQHFTKHKESTFDYLKIKWRFDLCQNSNFQLFSEIVNFIKFLSKIGTACTL